MKIKQFFADFKAFALKGNILDMAVGVVVGGAFSKIVTSLVNDIITPLIALITGDVALKDLKWVFSEAVVDAAGVVTTPEVALTYGNFLQTVIDFLIIAFSIFIILRVMMSTQKKLDSLKKKEEEAEEAAEEAATETELTLLTEIRDLLKGKEDTQE